METRAKIRVRNAHIYWNDKATGALNLGAAEKLAHALRRAAPARAPLDLARPHVDRTKRRCPDATDSADTAAEERWSPRLLLKTAHGRATLEQDQCARELAARDSQLREQDASLARAAADSARAALAEAALERAHNLLRNAIAKFAALGAHHTTDHAFKLRETMREAIAAAALLDDPLAALY